MAYAGYKPVHEDFLTKIVEVHWLERDGFSTLTIMGGIPSLVSASPFCDFSTLLNPDLPMSSSYLSDVNYVQVIADNFVGVTVSMTPLHFAPWTIANGTTTLTEFRQEGPAKSATIPIGGSTLNGIPGCYAGQFLGVPGTFGAPLTSGSELVQVGSSTITVDAPDEVVAFGGRYRYTKTVFVAGRRTAISISVSYEPV